MEDSKKLSIIKSNSGHDVLIINGIEMHSRFNPIQEAYEQAVKQSCQLEESSRILILGLGLGYHVQQIEFKMREFHQTPEIFVIEPNRDVAKLALNSHIIPQNHTTVFSGKNIERYYQNKKFIDFLSKKPTIITHQASLDLESTFFKKFLSYTAPSYMAVVNNVLDEDVQKLLKGFNERATFTQCLDDITKQELASQDNFKVLAFRELFNQIKETRGQI
jgi:hypothetical protein